VKIKTPYTYCEQVGRRGKDYKTKRMFKILRTFINPQVNVSNHRAVQYSWPDHAHTNKINPEIIKMNKNKAKEIIIVSSLSALC
jgi:hypothetical protein